MLNDITILVPYRYDQGARLRNLYAFLKHYAPINLPILIHDYSKKSTQLDFAGCDITIESRPYNDFTLTTGINELVFHCKTKYTLYIDVDVLIKEEDLVRLFCQYENLDCDFICGSYQPVYSLNKKQSDSLTNETALSEIECDKIYYPSCPGGFVLSTRKTYMRAGLENESFIHWGKEDRERAYRFGILGYNVQRANIVTYHLAHKNQTKKMQGTNNKILARMNEMLPFEVMESLLTHPQVTKYSLKPKFKSDKTQAEYELWSEYRKC